MANIDSLGLLFTHQVELTCLTGLVGDAHIY